MIGPPRHFQVSKFNFGTLAAPPCIMTTAERKAADGALQFHDNAASSATCQQQALETLGRGPRSLANPRPPEMRLPPSHRERHWAETASGETRRAWRVRRGPAVWEGAIFEIYTVLFPRLFPEIRPPSCVLRAIAKSRGPCHESSDTAAFTGTPGT